jgi:hypothetical protein
MNPISQPGSLSQCLIPLGGHHVQQSGLVLLLYGRQSLFLLAHHLGNGSGIHQVRLIRFTGPLSAQSRPASVDLIDPLAGVHQELGQPSAVAPGAFDAPLEFRVPVLGPPEELLPSGDAIWTPPVGQLSTGIVQCQGNMDSQGRSSCSWSR